MIRLRKDTKFIIILLIVVISLYLGYRRSGIKGAFFPAPTRVDTSVADKMFGNLRNNRKVLLKYNVSDQTEAKEKINEISFSDNITIKYSDIKSNYIVQILEIPKQEFQDVILDLRSIEGLSVENVQTGKAIMVDENIQESIKNNQIAKKRIQELINKTNSPESMNRFKQELEETQAKIDSLQNLTSMNNLYLDNDIYYITVIKEVEPSKTLKKASIEFVLTTFVMMIIIIVGLIVFFVIYSALSSLMNALGIKSSRGGRGSSNYNYNYNKRSYGRKVKRIYKKADGTREEKKDIK
ncbi:hypothetical protein ACFLYJ_02950 [Candidatus Cloacimonadota bacterium]